MAVIEVTLEGFENAQKVLNNLAEQIERPGQKVMDRLGEAVIDDIDNRFMTRGYGTWANLKPATWKRKKSGTILIETGEMFAGTRIDWTTDNDVSVSINKPSKPAVPGYHQTGTRHMVARPLVEVTPKLEKELVEVVHKWVEDMLRAFETEVS